MPRRSRLSGGGSDHVRATRRIRLPKRRSLGAAAAVVALAAAAVVGALTSAPASAHDYLVDSSPKAGSTQTTPIDSVRLTFDDVVLDLATSGPGALLQVTGPDGASTHFETGCPTVQDRNVTAPVALGGPGKYLVTWQVVSADGHVVSDSIVFTYAPPSGTTVAKGSATSPCKGAGATSTAKASAGTAQGTVDSGAIVIVVVIAVAIVVLALIAVLVLVLTRRRAR
ncbi:copper resistance protein CopC [Planctomonas sp. JC2975]|uniref:copper resistance CopC family protein n=1 Tax=Planctomonas sp. JC2975 TaxID=2729626 RepID=UPI0014761BDD|nr:copper resistance CopC family protein [Planctomonas sp. JC2975]NNC12169.1 copper resistance protein CopC [Planctomonas sp. JC2975]